jgi:CRISPR-associated exonuclease Cas4
MNINATLINYYHLCHRKLWLHANGITMEHTSDVVYEGKLIGEESYPQRAEKNQELEILAELDGGIRASAKIDFLMLKRALFMRLRSQMPRKEPMWLR